MKQPGFTLVVSVMLMMLLMMLGLAMLSLSAVTLRGSGQSQAMKMAQANARMALMVAMGELQSAMGHDQRVSASASAVLDQPQQPRLLGAWDSWRWQPDGSAPSYADKRGRFRRWLVSAPVGEERNASYPNQAPAADAIDLVHQREDGNGQSTRVQAQRIFTRAADNRLNGSHAWAVFDESAKAALDLSDPTTPMDRGQEIASRTAPQRFRADAVNASQLGHLRQSQNFISLETANVRAERSLHQEIHRRFHDFTTNTLGLLTDTANGGLKQDLSALFEPSTFNVANFGNQTTVYGTNASGAVRWQYLHNHYHKYNEASLTQQRNMPVMYQPTTNLNPSNLSINTTSRAPTPVVENLLPSIAKLQVVFSLVTHPERAQHRLDRAPQAQRGRYANPMLIYEAIVTVHNPYDVALRFDHLRFRVWNPPVGFRIAKVNNGSVNWLRREWQADPNSFHGLGRFNRMGQGDTALSNPRYFTVHLSDGVSSAASGQMFLQPGEVKVYSARVEKDWLWGWEVAGMRPGRPMQFLDHFNSDDMAGAGNRDRRTNNVWGVEAVPGWDVRAGLRMNHLSMEGGAITGERPSTSFYDFENLQDWWVADPMLHFDDELLVQMRPQKTTDQTETFRVDLMAGKESDQNISIHDSRDVLRSYRFRFTDPTTEISANPQQPVIQRRFVVGDLLQTLTDPSKGGKKPLAMLEMTARTTRDELDDSKAWLYNNPVTEGGDVFTSTVGLANHSHDLRLLELSGWSTAPMIEWDAADGEGTPGYGRAYFGASRNSAEGVTNVPMYRVPVAPAVSLGDWIPANLVASSRLPRVVHAFGNSRAHPLIPAARVSNPTLNGSSVPGLDHSFYLNDALWDRYYFSSIASMPARPWLSDQARAWQTVMREMMEGRRPALNSRITSLTSSAQAQSIVNTLAAMQPVPRSRTMSQHLAIKGPFNVNSTSVDAWRAVLSSLRDQVITGWGNTPFAQSNETPFVRMAMPLAGPNQTTQDVNLVGQIRWAGFRALTDEQIRQLAVAIVGQIRARGQLDQAPPLTLGEFVNRRIGAVGQVQSLAGILQSAIDQSGINGPMHALDSKNVIAAQIPAARRRGVQTPEAMNGFTGEGSPSMVTQGDLMMLLAPIATVRGDTFKIRAYGDALSPDGSTVIARAWCEATVQRLPEWVDSRDQPQVLVSDLTSPMNQRFGRRFKLTSFRWLNAQDL